jgi:hypothetical protein
VTGSGFFHATAGTLDGAASHGASGTLPWGGTVDVTWAGATGDIALSVTTLGKMQVNGVLGSPLPGLATGFLNWTGSAWAFSTSASSNTLSGATNVGFIVAGATVGRIAGTTGDYISMGAAAGSSAYLNVGPTPGPTTRIISQGGVPILSADFAGDAILGGATQVTIAPGGVAVETLTQSAVAFSQSNNFTVAPSGTTMLLVAGSIVNVANGQLVLSTGSPAAWSVAQGGAGASQPLTWATLGATGNIPIVSGATLSAAQYICPTLVLTGIMGASTTEVVTVPNVIGAWWVFDLTNVTFTTGSRLNFCATGSGQSASIGANSLLPGRLGVRIDVTLGGQVVAS